MLYTELAALSNTPYGTEGAMLKRKTLIVVAVILIPILLLVLRFGSSQWKASRLNVSPQTTGAGVPLRPDGYPDYLAALNERMSQGVTPENNAAVLLVRTVGVQELPPALRGEFLKRMGLPEALEPPSFVTWEKYARRIPESSITPATDSQTDPFEQLLEMIDRGTERPWRRSQYAPLAKWLDANAAGLEVIVEASKRPRYYTPLVATGDPPMLVSALLPHANDARQTALALVARAMLRLGEKQFQTAWDDLMACRRLGLLIRQGPTLVESLVGNAIEELAIAGQVEFLAAAELTAEQWAVLQADCEKLPARAPLADKFDFAERFMSLDLILAIAREGPKALQGATTGMGNIDTPLTQIALRGVDWNVPLMMANEWMDRVVAVARIGDAEERAIAAEKLEADILAMVAESRDPWGIAGAVLSRERASEKVGQIVMSLLFPSIGAMLQSDARLHTQADLLRVGLALARYKAKSGEYPSALADLAPGFLATIPADAFASTPFVYKKTANGYLLYSVGANQIDEQGRSYDQQADDLPIEIPRPPRPAPLAAESVEPNPAGTAGIDERD
jgi:hypothetical protein